MKPIIRGSTHFLNLLLFAVFFTLLPTQPLLHSAICPSPESFITTWLGQTNGATAGWFGLAKPLKSCGFSVTGEYKQQFLGEVSGGIPNQPKGVWVGEVKLKFQYDFEPVFGIKGLVLESNWRERFGGNPQLEAGTFNLFNPSILAIAPGLRILTQQLEYTTSNRVLTINAGWENPYEQFLQQPLSKLFENTAISSAKGIGGIPGPGIPVWSRTQKKYVNYITSPVPWGSTYAAWGGTVKIRPHRQVYVQSGLYAAISGTAGVPASDYTPTDVYPYTSLSREYLGQIRPAGYSTVTKVNANGQLNGTTTSRYVPSPNNNHGFNFQGSPTFHPNGNGGNYSQNGLYNVNEIGWEPKFGNDQLEGKYALGSYLWGQNNTSYTPASWVTGQTKPTSFSQNSAVWGLYLQADQQLFREKGTDAAHPSKQGLFSFNEATFTPPQNNALPFYFQSGVVYKGLIPHRDEDSIGIVLGAGFYSSYLNQYIDSQNQALKNGYGSTYNATVPNGPVSVPGINPNTGAATANKDYFAYAPHFSSTEVIESFYNVQLTKWASIKPGVQYIINPAGNGTVGNDWILEAVAKVTF